MAEPTNLTQEQAEALDIARQLIKAGVPVFAAPPCPSAHDAEGGGQCSRPGHADGHEEFDLPPKWQLTVPSEVWLERWQPGWALAAVGGHVADFLDEDPRSGGSASVDRLKAARQMPEIFGIQSTPSGGYHYLISAMGERKATPAAPDLPGLDYQGGAPDGAGRGFVWIAPTVKRSKVSGEPAPYRWEQPPDLEYLDEFRAADGTVTDDSITMLRSRIVAARDRRPAERSADTRSTREFTEQEARAFCDITMQRLMRAEIGGIEEAANAAAAQLSHFVPDFWSEDFAYAALEAALGATAYDPEHPASRWTAEKFRAVLGGQGGRAPGDWRAVRRAEALAEVAAPELDEVDALIGEMLAPDQIEDIPPPKHLIRGVLTMDSESWMIGAPGSKKSFVALDMAACVSTGRAWQELRVTQGPVVMIVAEGASGTGKRVKAWRKTHGPMGDIRFLPRPVQANNFGAWRVLVEACRRLAPSLIVLDTQARVTVGLEENSATDMGVYVEAVRALREATGACVLTVHHTGRRGQDARGSNALDGAQSSELTVKVEAGSLTGALSISKQKDIEEGPDIPLHFGVVDLGVDEDGAPVDSLVLLDPDAWRDAPRAADAVVEIGQQEYVPEPVADDWTWELVPDARSHNARRVLVILDAVAGESGMTKAEVCRVLRERWYEGNPLKGKRKGHMSPENWEKAWSSARALARGGEPVVSSAGGGRFMLNPESVSGLR